MSFISRLVLFSVVLLVIYLCLLVWFRMPEPSATYFTKVDKNWHTSFYSGDTTSWQLDSAGLQLTKVNSLEQLVVDLHQVEKISEDQCHIIQVEVNSNFHNDSAGTHFQGIGIYAATTAKKVEVIIGVNSSGELKLYNSAMNELKDAEYIVHNNCIVQNHRAELYVFVRKSLDGTIVYGQLRNCESSQRTSQTASVKIRGANLEVQSLSIAGLKNSKYSQNVKFNNLRIWRGLYPPD